MTSFINRAIGIATRPKAEWEVVEGETATTQGLLTGYVLPMAAISAVCGVIGSLLMSAMMGSVLGALGAMKLPGMAAAGVGVVGAVIGGVVGVAVALLITFVMGMIINALATSFGGVQDQGQAMKAAAYSPSAIWLAGIAAIIPGLGGLVVLAAMVWSIFIIHWGLSALMKPPPDKAAGYTAVVIIIWCVIVIVVGFITATVTAPFMIGAAIANHAL